MQGKTILITGAASGLGRVVARELAKRGAHVIVHARSAEKVAPVAAEIKAAGGSVDAEGADLSSLKETRALAERVHSRHAKLHGLVNNAGIWPGAREVTGEGFEKTWATNVLAPWLLTEMLIEPMKAAGGARVVNLSSNEHYLGNVNWDDLQFNKGYVPRYAYRRSKLALTMLTNEASARHAGAGVVFNSLHPGVSGETSLFRNFPRFIQWWTKILMRTTEGCAAPVVRLASASEVEGISGRFFRRFNQRNPHKLARDAASCKRLAEIVAGQTK